METIEKRARKKRRKKNIQKAVLAAIHIAGILAVTMVAPNVFQALPGIMGKKRYKLAFETRTAMQRLVVKGHIRFVERDGRKYAEITSDGRRSLAIEMARAEKTARTKRRWDKRWRIVMFDIPQRRKTTRDRLRMLMSGFDFLRLQNSVWVSPYDCEELIALVKAELHLGKDVLYAVVEEIENDGWIKKRFGLS